MIWTATVRSLGTLVCSGADVYQLFDSWAGMLRREEYERWAQPRHQAVFAAVGGFPPSWRGTIRR